MPYVAARLPSAGTLIGGVVARHADARATAVPAAWNDDWTEFLALVEGVPDGDLGSLLLAWNRRFGRPARLVGESFVLRLPMNLEAVELASVRGLLRLDKELPMLGIVAEDGWMEHWFKCQDEGEAEAVAARLRLALRHVHGAEVRLATPRPDDQACWEILHYAAGLPAET